MATTFNAERNKWDKNELFFRPTTLVLHDTLDNPTFEDWFTAGGALGEVPTTTFGSGHFSDDTGISLSDSPKYYDVTSQGYLSATRRYLESTERVFTIEYQQQLHRKILSEVVGVQIPEQLSAEGTAEFVQSLTPVQKGLRAYVINWEDTPDGVVAQIDILPRIVASKPTFERKGAEIVTTKIEYTIENDPETGYDWKTILGGAGFIARAEKLGYKAPTP